MDEYDEMFGIEDEFEAQFADELEVMAEMEPKAKRQKQDTVVKKLFGTTQTDGITPPSSPERPTASSLDISGFDPIPETPIRLTAVPTQGSSNVLKRPPLEGDYITVTDTVGTRVYLRQREEAGEKVEESRIVPDAFGALGLLAVPIRKLREHEAEKQILEESQRLTDLLAENSEEMCSRLWVDRFSPRHYTELLSDDFTNRCLLKWLKSWDTVVFGRERKARPVHSQQTSKQISFKPNQPNQNANRFKSKVEMTEELLEAELDQYKRPKFKVALLSGPPGLGKTTLAHVIANHAGYNVVEINADDRSAEVFQKRIDTATQMKSVLGANERPNCLVIDEIDGAPAAAINILLATINRKDGQKEGETAKKKKKKESILLRPIICICNDYVPALRPLRQQAFLLTFPQTQPSRLVQRLAEIAVHQGMKADTGTLMSLCEKTDNDIRSCINTLQFLFGRGHKQLDSRMIQSISVGQKDQNKGLFHLWQETFQLPRVKKRIGEGFEETPGLGGGTQRFQHILHLASSSGEYDKAAQGLYENYLSMRVRDPNLHNVCEALEWLSFSDRLNQVILHGQNFSLMRYLPFLSVTFHFLFAHSHVPRLSYPHSQHEKNALSTMLSDIPASIRTRISQLNLTLDILSLLLEVICPKLRPVNPQLFSSREKEQLKELIDTMLAYNLSYRQDRTPEGQYTYVLERVEDVVKFPGLPPRRQLTYQAKQTVSREMEQEKMRRAEQLLQRRNPEKNVVEAMGTAVGNSDVWFRFNEGMSNAVRRNVYIRELL
uniref:Chromosome transmission fidelity protein 18 homolog n=1 Tax=Periophthalmus magnuspinnatus TaxID=409849 RepID=A0A3B4AUM8_9GOBI